MASLKKIHVDWKKRPNSRELLFFTILLLFLFYGFLDAYLNPQLEKVRELKTNYNLGVQQQDTLEKVIQALDAQVAQQQTLKVEEKKDVLENPRLQKILQYRVQDSTEEIAATISLLSSKRYLKRMQFVDAKVGEQVSQAGYTLVPIEFNIQGHYTALVRYLEEVAQLEKPVLVNGFDVLANEKDAFLKTKLNVELYLPK